MIEFLVKFAAVLVIVVSIFMIIPAMPGYTVDSCLSYLVTQGYTAYADPAGDFYVNDLLPNADSTYDVGASGNEFAEGYLDNLYLTGTDPITLLGSARSWLEFRPDLDPTKLAVNAKPTIVTRGVALGYSLPVGGADEELFYSICVPNRWDGESDIYVHIRAWLSAAQDEASDAVKLSLNWQYSGDGDVVAGTYYTVTDEVVTGVVAQYTVIVFKFIIDYDTEVGHPILADDVLFFHLTRIASSHEIAGEPVVIDSGVIFRCDKFGNITP